MNEIKEKIYDTVNFLSLLKNKYANFVLQRLMGKFTFEEKPRLKDVLIKSYKMSGNKEKVKINRILNYCK